MASEPKPRGYVLNWLALVCLTALTFGLSHIDLGPLNTPVSFAIALAKASLIALIFMHLIVEDFTMRFILIGSALVLLLLVAVVSLDAHTRFPLATPPGSTRFQESGIGQVE